MLKVHINNNTALDQNGDGIFNITDVLVVIKAVLNCFELHIPSPTEFAIRQILTQYQTITEIAFAVSFFVVYNGGSGVVIHTKNRGKTLFLVYYLNFSKSVIENKKKN